MSCGVRGTRLLIGKFEDRKSSEHLPPESRRVIFKIVEDVCA